MSFDDFKLLALGLTDRGCFIAIYGLSCGEADRLINVDGLNAKRLPNKNNFIFSTLFKRLIPSEAVIIYLSNPNFARAFFDSLEGYTSIDLIDTDLPFDTILGLYASRGCFDLIPGVNVIRYSGG